MDMGIASDQQAAAGDQPRSRAEIEHGQAVGGGFQARAQGRPIAAVPAGDLRYGDVARQVEVAGRIERGPVAVVEVGQRIGAQRATPQAQAELPNAVEPFHFAMPLAVSAPPSPKSPAA